MKKNSRGKKPLHKYIALTGIAFQMGATIFLCAYAGKKLDIYYGIEEQWFTVGFVLFGVVASIYLVIKQLNKINKSN